MVGFIVVVVFVACLGMVLAAPFVMATIIGRWPTSIIVFGFTAYFAELIISISWSAWLAWPTSLLIAAVMAGLAFFILSSPEQRRKILG